MNKIIAEAPGSVQATLAQDNLNKLRAGSQPPDLVAKYEKSLEGLREVILAVESFRIMKDWELYHQKSVFLFETVL